PDVGVEGADAAVGAALQFLGAVRSSAWIWDFSSTHSTTAASGGSRYRPTTSYTLSTNNGSLDSLKVSARCGWRPKSRQIRPIVDFDNPDRSAINLRDQCVAFFGVSSRVATTTSSTWSRAIDGGRPGRSSSTSPSRRLATNRDRHLPTVAGCTPSSEATGVLAWPSAQASTIRERWASACDDLALLDQPASV